MTYATAEERSSLIAGLRVLATYLEGHPRVSAPRWADVLVFPPEATDRDMRKERDRQNCCARRLTGRRRDNDRRSLHNFPQLRPSQISRLGHTAQEQEAVRNSVRGGDVR